MAQESRLLLCGPQVSGWGLPSATDTPFAMCDLTIAMQALSPEKSRFSMFLGGFRVK